MKKEEIIADLAAALVKERVVNPTNYRSELDASAKIAAIIDGCLKNYTLIPSNYLTDIAVKTIQTEIENARNAIKLLNTVSGKIGL